MPAAKPAEQARRLVDEAEFEIDSIKETMLASRALDRPAAPKPPPLPVMQLSPAVAPANTEPSRESLASRLALLDAS